MPQLSQLIAPFCLLMAFVACSKPPMQEEPTPFHPSPPNIIYILVDDLGYGDLSCYGQTKFSTPHIDQLAREGIRFSRHYAGSTVCAPSRASLMTGFHTGHSPIRGNREVRPMGQMPLADSIRTVAEYLKDLGYTTGLIGKWGLGGPGSEGHPRNQGFDHFYGYLCQRHAHNYYPAFLFRDTFRQELPNVMPDPPRPDGAGQAIEKNVYAHELLIGDALEFIGHHQGTRFFMALTLTIPHANNEAGDAGMEVPDLGAFDTTDWPTPEKGKAAMIKRLDQGIGHIMTKLKNAGIDDQTLVIFTSDNGPHAEGGVDPQFLQSSGPFRGIKRDLYEGGIRVPMIARWPGIIEQGRTSGHVSAFWDVLPTLIDIGGGEIPSQTDGISFLPSLTQRGTQAQHEHLYWEFHSGKPAHHKEAVLSWPWKMVHTDFQADGQDIYELYNLETDSTEQVDLIRQQPDQAQRLKRIMKASHSQDINWPLLAEEHIAAQE